MRISCITLIVVCVSSLSSGQIPNAGFEFWSTDPDSNVNPAGWQTTNSYPLINVEPVAPGYRGAYAMKVKTVDAGIPIPGVAALQTALNFGQVPTRFSAYVRSKIMPGDRAYIIVGLMKGDSIIAATDSCTFKIDSTFSQFTYHEFPIAIQSQLLPDSLLVMVASGLGNGKVGTELIIDDIGFAVGGSTDVTEERSIPGGFSLLQNYPNPFNPATVISFLLPAASGVRLEVYDLLGRKTSVLLDERKAAGRHEVRFDASGLPSGAYLYRLAAGQFVRTRMMVVVK